MKLLSLNVWGGKRHQPLLDFVSKYAGKVDFFCFQEVFSSTAHTIFSSGAKMNLYEDLASQLFAYTGYFAVKSQGYDYDGYAGLDVSFGNAFFCKKELLPTVHSELFNPVIHPDHDWKQVAVGKAQTLEYTIGGKHLGICNFHGLWMSGTLKKDNDQRIAQSQQVKELLNRLPGEKILCGDFNLLPDGQSIAILEQGMENLIKTHHVTSTRSSLYDKEMKFADYILVSKGIKVNTFEVLTDEVSDHLPLYLDFSL